MKQFTSHIDFSLTKKRLLMMSSTLSIWRAFPKMLFTVSMLSVLAFISCTETKEWPNYMTWKEVYDRIPPTTYYDVELEPEGVTGLYHPLDERTGTLIGLDGEPYTGERNKFSVDTDSVIYKETIVDGKIVRTEHTLRDSTNTPHKWVTIPSIDVEGNKVTSYYSDRLTDSLVLNMKKIDTDSLITTKAWHPNGQLAWEFQMMVPGGGMHGLTTIYDENGTITEQDLYDRGELIKKIK